MDATTRTQFAEITGHCDRKIDEHTAYTWADTRVNTEDHLTEVRHECQCGERGYWVALAAARRHGYTG